MPPVSKIATLPEELRAWLHRAIVERGYGDIVALTDELNAMCKAGGVAITIGKSAVGAESLKLRRAQESIRATTEAARLIAETAPDEADHRSAAAMAIVQSEMFDLLLKVREADDLEDADRMGVMNAAALALSRISRSRVNQSRWAVEVEARARAAADSASKLARQGGLSEATVAEIRASILGIMPKTPGQASQAGG